MASKRIPEIDICKGFGMCLVILGHFSLLGDVTICVRSFYMPMFVILSGMFYRYKPTWEYFKSIMFPYFTLGLLCIVFCDGITGVYDVQTELVALLCGCTSPQYIVWCAAPLWFLSMLFVLKSLYSILDKTLKNELLLTAAVIVISVGGWFLAGYRTQIGYVYNFDIAMVFMPFFHIGKLCKNLVRNEAVTRTPVVVALFVTLTAASYLVSAVNGGFDVFNQPTGGNYFLYYLAGVIGTYAAYNLSSILAKSSVLTGFFSLIGRQSMIILVVHYPLTLGYLLLAKTYGLPWWGAWIGFCVVLGLSLAICWLLQTHFPYLVRCDFARNRNPKGKGDAASNPADQPGTLPTSEDTPA